MSKNVNLNFMIGETWELSFLCVDASCNPIDLSTADFEFRLVGPSEFLDLTPDSPEVTVSTTVLGQVTIAITPDDQASMLPGIYKYESRVTMPDTSVISQQYGVIYAKPSLYREYRPAGEDFIGIDLSRSQNFGLAYWLGVF